MRVAVILQMIEYRLIKLSDIADSKHMTANRDVECESMAHGGHIARISEKDIVVIVPQRECFEVALSIIRREGNAYHGN